MASSAEIAELLIYRVSKSGIARKFKASRTSPVMTGQIVRSQRVGKAAAWKDVPAPSM